MALIDHIEPDSCVQLVFPAEKRGTLIVGRARQRSIYPLIWEVVRKIPRGKVATYGQIARLVGLVGQGRMVGHALRNLPARSDVPWHRVINSQGRISLPREKGAYFQQKQLLEREGIVFTGIRIDLEKFGWLRTFERGRK